MITSYRPSHHQPATFYRKTTLDNGLRVVTSRMEHVHSASITFLFDVGSRYEPSGRAGISHFIEHMLFKGTERRPEPMMITSEIEEVGGMINAATGRESTTYWVKIPATHIARAFDVLADIVRNSSIPEIELERERSVIVEEIRGVNDTPDDLVHDLIDEVIWPNQGIGRPVLGNLEAIQAITRDDLVTFINRFYRPDRMVIAAAGDVDHEQLVKMADAWFGDLGPGNGDVCEPARKVDDQPRIHVVNRSTEQAHLCVGHAAISYRDPRRYAQSMIDSVLSSGMSSRLFQEIRERRGLVYAVYGYFRQYADAGQGVVYAGTDLHRVEETIAAIVGELQKISQQRVSNEELSRNKELAKGRILIGLEDSRAVASWIGGQELTHGEIKTPEEVMELIDAVTVEDMGSLAEEIYRENPLHLVLIGPYDNGDRFSELVTL